MFINLDENSVFIDGVLINGKARSVELIKSGVHKDEKVYRIDFGFVVSVVCETHVIVSPKEPVKREAPQLIETDGLQYKISDYGNQIHNLSCSVDDEDLQQELGAIAHRLWQIKVETPEEKAARERDSGIMAMMEVALNQSIGGEPLEAYRGNAAYRICEKLYDAQYRK